MPTVMVFTMPRCGACEQLKKSGVYQQIVHFLKSQKGLRVVEIQNPQDYKHPVIPKHSPALGWFPGSTWDRQERFTEIPWDPKNVKGTFMAGVQNFKKDQIIRWIQNMSEENDRTPRKSALPGPTRVPERPVLSPHTLPISYPTMTPHE